jgi:erythrin-vacuolar iron transport family protein
MMRFSDLSEQEILALAISSEEEDSKIYRGFAEGLREQYPASAKVFDEMADEEVGHRTMLFDHIRPLSIEIRRVFTADPPSGRQGLREAQTALANPAARSRRGSKICRDMELEWARFYHKAAQSARDSSIRELLDRLADVEDEHESIAHKLGETILTQAARAREDATSRRLFVLQYVQPGLAGLMDGSVSTLAPLFAAAFATHNTWPTFLVGIAASVGAGIPWHLPRLCLTTARSLDGVRLCCVVRFVER